MKNFIYLFIFSLFFIPTIVLADTFTYDGVSYEYATSSTSFETWLDTPRPGQQVKLLSTGQDPLNVAITNWQCDPNNWEDYNIVFQFKTFFQSDLTNPIDNTFVYNSLTSCLDVNSTSTNYLHYVYGASYGMQVQKLNQLGYYAETVRAQNIVIGGDDYITNWTPFSMWSVNKEIDVTLDCVGDDYPIWSKCYWEKLFVFFFVPSVDAFNWSAVYYNFQYAQPFSWFYQAYTVLDVMVENSTSTSPIILSVPIVFENSTTSITVIDTTNPIVSDFLQQIRPYIKMLLWCGFIMFCISAISNLKL